MTLQEASLNIPEQEYHELPMLSYSVLSKYDREGYGSLATLDEKITTPSLTFGSMVDCLLTQGQEAFDSQYVATDLPSMSETLQTVAGILLEQRSEPQFAVVPDDAILDAANIVGFYPNYKDPTRIAKIRDGVSVYYNFMKSNKDKIVVDTDMYNDALHCAEVLKSHPLTMPYFAEPGPFDDRNVYFQLQFQSEYDRIPYKGMLDLVVIDHKNKVIYPCDLKTTKDIYSFEDSFYKYRYYIQASMYTALLRDVIMKQCPWMSDYRIAPYRFIVIDRKIFRPVVFQWETVTKVVTPYGEERKYWTTLLKEVDWALKHKDEQLPKQWSEKLTSLGVIPLN